MRRLPLVRVMVACVVASAVNSPASALDPVVIDDFATASTWSAHPADGVELTIGADPVDSDPALRLDFRFQGGGYAIARRELELALPTNYAFTFRVRGECLPNHLEFKLVDGSGENVWWHVRRDVAFSPDYQRFRIAKRKIQFAWGPRGGGEIDTVRAIEFAITAGSGGSGTVWIDDLTLVPLPPPETKPLEVAASASSNAAAAARVLDGDPGTTWSADSADHAPWLLLDLGRLHEFSGLVIEWEPPVPTRYRVELSEDGSGFSPAMTVAGSDGGRDPLLLPDSEARYIRILADPSGAPGIGATPEGTQSRADQNVESPMEVASIEIVPLDRFANRDAFFHDLAKAAPRGLYPRGVYGEQAYWTVVGLDHDDREVLFGEEGAIELWAGGPSVEPFVQLDGRLYTWADAELEARLEDGYLPIPTVRWSLQGSADGLRLAVTALARDGDVASGVAASEATRDPSAAEIAVRYRISNDSEHPLSGELLLAIRPFQVNPPSQFLNLKGGTTNLSRLSLGAGGAIVGDLVDVSTSPPATRFGAVPFAGGDIVADHLSRGALPSASSVDDPFGAVSGAVAFPFALEPGAHADVVARFSLEDDASASTDTTDLSIQARSVVETGSAGSDTADTFAHWLQHEKDAWRTQLDRVRISLPPSGQRYIETMKAQLGFILVNRAGPAIQPGVRSYARSWIRDGSLTSSALLRLGHAPAAREFLEWFAPHQYENGKIPCVVDRRGADPVPEHDSSGQFIYLVAEIYRFTGDRALAERHWPRVLAAAGYLDALRRERLGPEYQSEAMRAFYGILPPSISHEGYSAKPMHSYWDDFFALRGFRDAAFLAEQLGKPEADSLRALAAEFSRDLAASIQAAQDLHQIDYVPGCADLGDFDATSTTIALTPVGVLGEQPVVPAEDLEATFERYMQFFHERQSTGDWDAYTPYELRNVGACIRLGWRDRAHELLRFFFPHQRPEGWRSWAEVVDREERRPRFIGDIPHTWVGSDYIRAFLDMFVALDPNGRRVLIGAGVPNAWLEGDGVTVENLPTPFGEVSLRMFRTGDATVRVEVSTDGTPPDDGWILRPPPPAGAREGDGLASQPRSITVNGEPAAPSSEIRVRGARVEATFAW